MAEYKLVATNVEPNNGESTTAELSTLKVGAVNYSLPSGGSGGATCKYWSGTAVPNSGTVENIYINTNLTPYEVVKICANLIPYTSTNPGTQGAYTVFYAYGDSLEDYIQLLVFGDNTNAACMISHRNTSGFMFVYSTDADYNAELEAQAGFLGFNPNAVNHIVLTQPLFSNDGEYGAQNALLSSLFSTTPFVQNECSGTVIYQSLANAQAKLSDLETRVSALENPTTTSEV